MNLTRGNTPVTAVNPWAGFDGHEEVITVVDPGTGVHIIVAIHSTVLGPALGGVRMSTYSGEADPLAAAYVDALRLSRAMTYKNALAGLHHGGGKAVIVADPQSVTTDVLHAYGRVIESLQGRYVTAADVGMTVDFMDTIGDVCSWTTGRSPERGGVGDSAILTAVGVFEGMRAAAESIYGSAGVTGLTVGVVGAGKVGGRLIDLLTQAGAHVVVTDPSQAALDAVLARNPDITVAGDLEELLAHPLDVLSPNALGGLLTPELADRLTVRLVCGGANNQLAAPEVADLLAARGIVFAPDFMVNCGGVVQVAEELVGADIERARATVLRVRETTARVLDRAAREGITPVQAAEAEAEARIAATATSREP